MTSGLLDYVFSAEATRAFSAGPALLSFFSCFWLVVGVVSFVLQVLARQARAREARDRGHHRALAGRRRARRRLRAGRARGSGAPRSSAEARRRSATRSSERRTRCSTRRCPRRRSASTKTLIDVGFDRLGTVAAAGIVVVVLAITGAHAEMVLLALAVGVALVTLTRSRALHTGYVTVLEQSLRLRATSADLAATTTTTMASDERAKVASRSTCRTGRQRKEQAIDLFGQSVPRRSPSSSRAIRRASVGSCRATRPSPGRWCPSPSCSSPTTCFSVDAMRALRRCAPRTTGCSSTRSATRRSPSTSGAVSRASSRTCPTEDAARGLVRAMADERFEVRYECARALLEDHAAQEPRIVVSSGAGHRARQERGRCSARKSGRARRHPRLDDGGGSEPPALIDRLLRDRLDRSLEHVFTLLALQLDRVSLRLAFKALHEKDERLRGTALEYLETVLPDEMRDDVWPFLGEERPMRPRRPVAEILMLDVSAWPTDYRWQRSPGPAPISTSTVICGTSAPIGRRTESRCR